MKLIVLFVFLLNTSCYHKFEKYNNNSKIYEKEHILENINKKEKYIYYLNKEKILLEHKNKEILFIIDFNKKYNSDIEYLENTLEKNQKDINKINLNIKRILLELKMLKESI